MIRILIVNFLIFITLTASGQEIDKDLLIIKGRMDAVEHFTADLQLDLEVPFINMPTKYASMAYTNGEEVQFSSDDFVMLPKRGLDFSLSELFKHPFITVDRGMQEVGGKAVKVLNIIPDDEKSAVALATLYLDVVAQRITASKITTKKEGTYDLKMDYKNVEDILPSFVEVSFAIEKLKIPLNFMGSDTTIDRKKMKQTDTKTGKIYMKIDNYKVDFKE